MAPAHASHPVWLVVIIGAALCAVLTVLPDLLPRFVDRPGFAWTPFNSPNYRVGDLYYYAPWVRELATGQWPLQPPTAIGEHSGFNIENMRAAPILLAALPAWLFADFRDVIVANHIQSAVLFFLGYFFLAYALLRRPWPSFAAAAIGFFYGGLWQSVPANAQFLQLIGGTPSFDQFWDFTARGVLGRIQVLADPSEYDYIGDAFRYLHLSFSGPLQIFHGLAAILLFLQFGWWRAIALLLLSILLAFSYPSHPFIGYLTMIALATMALLTRRWREFAGLTAVGLIVIGFLVAVNFPALLREALQSSYIVQTIYVSGIKLGAISGSRIFHTIIINKYLITTMIALVLFWHLPAARSAILAIGVVVNLVSWITLLEPPELWPRFLSRGIDLLWFGIVAASLVRAVAMAGEGAGQWLGRRTIRIAGALAILGLLLVPAKGLATFAFRNMDNLSRVVPQDQWDAYQWIDRNVPRHAVVATLDWDDIAFLSVYVNVNLVTGFSDLSGRQTDEQFRRFVGVWKLHGGTREELERHLLDSVSAMLRRAQGNVRWPPLNTPQDYPTAQLAAGLFYWPYLTRLGNVPVATVDMARTNPELVEYGLSLFDQIDTGTFARETAIRYVLVDASMVRRAEAAFPVGTQVAFRNARRVIYRIADRPS